MAPAIRSGRSGIIIVRCTRLMTRSGRASRIPCCPAARPAKAMRIAVNGVELFFDVYGSGLAARGNELVDKPVIVALHGGPGIDHSQFVPWLTPIADVAQLILVDHRGNGRSSRPPVETRTLANMANDLEALRTALGLGRIVVFGMSFGGMLALT